MDSPDRIIGAVLGLSAFGIACVMGLGAELPPQTILIRAILAMLACKIVGVMIGHVAIFPIREHVETYRSSRPVPKVPKMEPIHPD